MTDAFIAMTIKVTEPSGVKHAAKHWAGTISSAISTIMQTGGRANVYRSALGDTEPQAVASLAEHVMVEHAQDFGAPKLPGDLVYAITTNSAGKLMLVNPDGFVLQERDVQDASDECFTDAVTDMIEAEATEQYTRS